MPDITKITKTTTTYGKTNPTSDTIQGYSEYSQEYGGYVATMSESSIGSTRLFGLPHQLLPHNDIRIGVSTANQSSSSNLGRLFAEKFVLEAPIVAIQPGRVRFLPNADKEEREGFVKALASSGEIFDKNELLGDADIIRYYDMESAYSDYMDHVNIMCKVLIAMLGIGDKKCPWTSGSKKLSSYDWRGYKFNSMYNYNSSDPNEKKGFFGFVKSTLSKTAEKAMNNYTYIQFYIDASDSSDEGMSNSTTESVLKTYTEKISSLSKEIQTIAGMSGMDTADLTSQLNSTVDSWTSSNSASKLGSFFKRLTSTATTVLSGSNFLIPDIWSSSDFDSGNHSFKVTLSTPYGSKLAWFMNIGLPLMYIVTLVLPVAINANSYTSPYLVKAFCPGQWYCSLGVIANVGIDKGGQGKWSVDGLPLNVEVSIQVKDLYSSLALPATTKAKDFMSNSGLLEFLMITAGIDISRQELTTKWNIWISLFTSNITNKFTRIPSKIYETFQSNIMDLFRL